MAKPTTPQQDLKEAAKYYLAIYNMTLAVGWIFNSLTEVLTKGTVAHKTIYAKIHIFLSAYTSLLAQEALCLTPGHCVLALAVCFQGLSVLEVLHAALGGMGGSRGNEPLAGAAWLLLTHY